MAYNEKLDAMNSSMAANAAENNSRAMSNFMNLGINTLSNISDIVSKLDEDKANDLIDDANNKMTAYINTCLLYTSPSPRDQVLSRMPSSA